MALCEDEPGLEPEDRARLIEQALYFAMGFLVASLAAVVWTPIVSRRARRLSEARARLQAPMSEKQAIAERDALRAQHAVDQVRLERRLTLAEEASIALRSELGRQSVKVITLEADATEHRSFDFDRRKQIEALSAERRDLEVALGAKRNRPSRPRLPARSSRRRRSRRRLPADRARG